KTGFIIKFGARFILGIFLKYLNIIQRLNPVYLSNETSLGQISPTLIMVESYYTRNGLPINEYRTWNFSSRYRLQRADEIRIRLFATRLYNCQFVFSK